MTAKTLFLGDRSTGKLFVVEKDKTLVWKCDFIAHIAYISKAGILLPCDININSTHFTVWHAEITSFWFCYSSKISKMELRSSWKNFSWVAGGEDQPLWIAIRCCTTRTPNLLERKGIPRPGVRSRLPCVDTAPKPRVKTRLYTRVYLCLSLLSDLLFAGLQIIFLCTSRQF